MLHNQGSTLIQREPNPAHEKSLRLLVAADSAKRLDELKMRLGGRGISITAMMLPKRLSDLRTDQHDLVVIDTCPTMLKESLIAFRERSELTHTPLLVASHGMAAEPELLGVLPRFRAMYCGPTELRSLIRYYLNEANQNRDRGLL